MTEDREPRFGDPNGGRPWTAADHDRWAAQQKGEAAEKTMWSADQIRMTMLELLAEKDKAAAVNERERNLRYEQRFEAQERAIEVSMGERDLRTEQRWQALQDALGVQGETCAAAVVALSQLHQQRFDSIDKQLEVQEEQRKEQKNDRKSDLDAALAAAKEAVSEDRKASDKAIDKSDAATARAIDALKITFDTTDANRLRDIGEIKERVGKIENLKLGSQETRDRSRDLTGVFVGLAGLVLTVVTIVVAVLVTSGGGP